MADKDSNTMEINLHSITEMMLHELHSFGSALDGLCQCHKVKYKVKTPVYYSTTNPYQSPFTLECFNTPYFS